MRMRIVSGIMLTLLVIGMLPLTFNIQQVKAEPITWTVGDSGSSIWGTPQDSSLKSTPESFYTSVVDIIHPQPGQFAHYFLQQYISPPGIGWWNTSYNEYVQPHIINTTHRVEDPFENGTYWCTVDTTNRWVTDTDPDSWWNQTWYGDWIETNVTVGSVIDWWWANATIFGSETLYVVGRDVDCWVANASSEGSYTLLYYDKLSGLLVKSKDFVFGGELSWEYTLNATNIISEPRTWTVDDDGPADFQTIREAINAASDGDIIYVYNGTYYGHVVISKSVSLIGENRSSTLIDGNGTGTVITVSNVKDVIIAELTAQNGVGGISLVGTRNITLTRNNMRNNQYNFFVGSTGGPDSQQFTHNIDSSNTVDGKPVYYWVDIHNDTIPQDAGFVALVNSTNITVQNLRLSNNGEGLLLVNSNACKIVGNYINNSLVGLAFGMSYHNTIIGNTISLNHILCYNFYGFANNILYHNNFLNSSLFSTYELGSNIWDNGYPSGGNYWSDYEKRYPDAQELDDSGIWNTPYVIDENNQDNYPLMEPWSPKPPSPVEATQELIETIEIWELPKGTENSLKAKLKVAIHMLDMGKEDGAIRKLTDFINRVEMLREKTLTNEQADELVSEAQRIIGLING